MLGKNNIRNVNFEGNLYFNTILNDGLYRSYLTGFERKLYLYIINLKDFDERKYSFAKGAPS